MSEYISSLLLSKTIGISSMVVVAVHALTDHQQHRLDTDKEWAFDHAFMKWTSA